MKFTTFNQIGPRTNIFVSRTTLQEQPCGLHRTNFQEALELMPTMTEVLESCPIPSEERDEWEVDVKIHMLMKGMYPCIPNWHCDNVPRIDGKLQYDAIDEGADAPMMLWIDSGPHTEFLLSGYESETVPKNHGELAQLISQQKLETVSLPPQQWVTMKQNTPHRGRAATEYGWRIFVRLTHRSILPARPVISKIRRHAQVYLPHDFNW